MDKVTVEVQLDETGEFFVELPQEMLEEVEWQTGDDIRWIQRPDGSFLLENASQDSEEKFIWTGFLSALVAGAFCGLLALALAGSV